VTKASPARTAALVVLRRVEQRAGYSNRILGEVLEQRPDMDRRDRGLATVLVYGVLRHRARLDAILDALAHRPRKLKGELREILRIAAFELLELGKPAAVVGSQAQALARRIDRRGALRGLITGLVSAIAREGSALDAKHEAMAPADALERRWSIPRWLAIRWVARLGAERASARARALAAPPRVDLRVDVTRIEPAEALAQLRVEHPSARFETVEDQPQCIRSVGAGDVFYGPLHDDGLISVQSLGSQQAVRLLAPRPGEAVLDACAGLGTKTLQIAESLQRSGRVVAIDTDPDKLERLQEIRERGQLGDLELTTIVGDASAADGVEGPFDAILLDAPCTGLGDLARHPELRWRSDEAEIERNAIRQARLLAALLPRLRPGGRLVYSVCSLEPEEANVATSGDLLAHAGARIDRVVEWTPEEHATDGFVCSLVRRN
jgi:16S rRNA (cytosine967-C5)-methyltransferase